MKKSPERRKRRLRLLRRALALALLIPLLLAAIVALFPGPLFRWLAVPRLEEEAARILGFPLRVREADLGLGGKLTLAGVEAQGPAPRTGIHAIRIERAEVLFSLHGLLSGRPDWIEEVRVEAPEVVLDLRHEPFLPPGGEGAAPADGKPAATPRLPRVLVSRANLRIHDGRETLVLQGVDASLDGRNAAVDIAAGSGNWKPPRVEAIAFPLSVRAVLAEGPEPFRKIQVERLAFGRKEIARGVEVDLSSPGEVRIAGRLPGWGARWAEARIAGEVLDLRVTVEDAPIAEILSAFTPWRCPAGQGTGNLHLVLPLEKEEDWRAEADMEVHGVEWPETGLSAARLHVRGRRGDDLALACEVLALDFVLGDLPEVDVVARFGRDPPGPPHDPTPGPPHDPTPGLPHDPTPRPGASIHVEELAVHRGGLSAAASGALREEDLFIEDGHVSLAPASLGALADFVPGAPGLDGRLEADVYLEGHAGRPETFDASVEARGRDVRGLVAARSLDVSAAGRLASCGVRIERAHAVSGASEASFAATVTALDFPLVAEVTRLEGFIEGVAFEAAVPPVVEIDPAGYRAGPAVLSILGGGAAFAVEGETEGRTEAWAEALGLDLSCLLDPLALRGDPGGLLSAAASVRLPGESEEEPRLEANARVEELEWTVGGRRLTGAAARFRALGGAAGILLDEVQVERGPDSVVLSASVPVEWSPFPVPARGAPLSVFFEAKVADIADLPVSFQNFRDIGGRVSVEGTASIRLEGRPGDILRGAKVEAEVLLEDGTLKLYGDAPPLTNLHADIRLRGRDVSVESLTGTARGSPFRLDGTAVVRPPWAEGGAGIDGINFHLTSEGALLVRSPQLRVRGDLDVTWRGPWDRAVLGGQVRITRAYYTRDISLLPGRGASLPPRLFSVSEPPFADTRFAIRVRGDRSIVVRNNLVSTNATADLLLGGTGREPVISGTLSARDGWVSVGSARLTLRSALVEFLEADPLNPRLNILLGDTIRSYSVSVAVSGTLEAPEVLLDSSPPLERERILVLIATGLTYDEIEERGVDRVAAVRAAVYMGRKLARYFATGDPTEASFFDRVSLHSESARSSRYEDPLRVEFRMFDNVIFDKDEVFLQGERDAYGDYNFNTGFRFEID